MKNTLKKIINVVAKTILIALLISILIILIFKWLPVPFTPLMGVRKWEYKDDKSFKTRYQWKSIDKISDKLPLAIMASEDQNFILHNGLDFEAIEDAIDENKKRKRPRGASTVSQQVAKNLFLWQGRSYVRKGLEVYFTFMIELLWSKQRIMEVYVNIVEFGHGIYGAEAACQYFYKKPALKLSVEQASIMAASLPNPRIYKINKPGKYMLERAEWIREQMRYWGYKMTYDEKETRKILGK